LAIISSKHYKEFISKLQCARTPALAGGAKERCQDSAVKTSEIYLDAPAGSLLKDFRSLSLLTAFACTQIAFYWQNQIKKFGQVL